MVRFSQCLDCKNYYWDEKKDENRCKAFPDGIPMEIFLSEISHRDNIPGDNGYKFENIYGKKS